MEQFTTKDLEVISHLMSAEQIACKKARIYANTLTDQALAQEMSDIAQAHAQRFCALYKMLGGKG